MLRKENYADLSKYHHTKAQQQRRQRQRDAMPPKDWTADEMQMVLDQNMTDRQLSHLIGHSINAIRVMRSRLKKAAKEVSHCEHRNTE
jgi:hypothetical protein